MLLYTFLFVNININAQSLELFGGITSNKFFDWESAHPNEVGTYSSGKSNYFGIGLHQIKLDNLRFGITINYEKYGGEIREFSGGHGGGNSTNATIDKSLLSFGLFPLNKKVLNNLNIQVGIIISALLKENFSGTTGTTIVFDPSLSTKEDLQVKYKSYNSSAYLGIKGSLSYDIYLSSKIALSSQYSYYLGLSGEVKNFQRSLRSMRHYFGIGLKKKLK